MLRWIALLGSIAVVIYWSWTYRGLYAVFTRIEIAVAGTYIPVVTALITWIVVFLSLHVATGLVALAAGVPFNTDEPLIAAASVIPATKFFYRHFVAVFGAMLIVGGLVSGSYFLVDAYRAGPLVEVRVDKLYAGDQPPGRYVDLAGQILRSERYTVGIGGSTLSSTAPSPDYYYFPIVPEGWRPDDNVRVIATSFYETDKLDFDQRPNVRRGILRSRVPGVVLDLLQDKVKVADDVWLLDTTMDPASDRQLGFMLLIGFSGLGLLVEFFGLVAYLNSRKRPAPPA